MNMLRHIALLVLALLYHSLVFAESFTFEGFYLGMSRADATSVKPEVPWLLVMKQTPTETVRKEMVSKHFGREARVSVDLDQAGHFVRRIGFTFFAATDAQCIADAVSVYVQLERNHGAPLEATGEPPGRMAMWSDSNGYSVRWAELCAAGARQSFVVYAKPAD